MLWVTDIKNQLKIKIELYTDANNLYGYAMSQSIRFDEIIFYRTLKIDELLNIPDNSAIGFFVAVDSKYPDKIKEKTNNFPFAPDNKKQN